MTQGDSTTQVRTQFDIGALESALAGSFIVFNVPVGPTTITATYGTHHFHSHVVPSIVEITVDDASPSRYVIDVPRGRLLRGDGRAA